MALYIKPPAGSIPFNKLYCFVMKRLVFLYYIKDHSVEDVIHVIEREALTNNSDCLIEGTVKDKISHFTLRFLCTSDSMLQDFFIQNEVKLFSYRLQFMDLTRVQLMLRKALPFTLGLKFVKNRSYPLHLGFLILPLVELKSLLICLFEELVVEGINQIKKSLCCKELDDPRMQYMTQKIKKWLHYELNPVQKHYKRILYGYNLIAESKKFPLCMYNLHNQLLKHHRLKHTSRIQYTLFLKEIGVPSNDAIHLFMKEYSKPFIQTHKDDHSHCSHNWTDSKNRYIYSIEHLYGMRGARKNYRAHNCQSLQNFYDSEGGCPFIAFDDQHLQKALRNQNLEVCDIEDIMTMVHKKEYCKACSSYLLCKVTMYQRERTNQNNNQTMISQYNSQPMKSVTDTFNILYPDVSSVLNQDNHLLLASSLKISSPSDFYSILSSYIDEQL